MPKIKVKVTWPVKKGDKVIIKKTDKPLPKVTPNKKRQKKYLV